MAYNNQPIFVKAAKNTSVAVTAANTSSQGGGTIATDIFLLYTAPATEPAYIRKITAIPTASVAATATTATVGRLFISSQSSGATTNANTHLLREWAQAAQTAAQTTTPIVPIEIPLGIWLEAGKSLLLTNHAAPAANTQWKYTVEVGEASL